MSALGITPTPFDFAAVVVLALLAVAMLFYERKLAELERRIDRALSLAERATAAGYQAHDAARELMFDWDWPVYGANRHSVKVHDAA